MLRITRRWRHLARMVEAAGILARYNGYNIIDHLGLHDLVPAGIRPPEGEADFPSKLRAALGELGPTFVKLGQLLSTRPDIVPPRYLEELVKLQDTAPPVPFDKVRKVVEEELGEPMEEAFLYFSRTPIAAASLGQAHTAALHDGAAVVVKVQRPDVRRVVEVDTELIFDLAHWLMQRSERARVLNVVDLVEEFRLTTLDELDYTREGRNMDRLRGNLSAYRKLHVPEVYWELTTTRVLTQERLHGTKITDVERLRERGIDPAVVARLLGEVFMKQIFIDGFFHADPHPGNIIVLDDGSIGLLDFGMVARMDESMRESVTRLLVSFVEQDSPAFAERILMLGRELQRLDRKRFTADADRMLRRYYDLPARDVNIGALLRDTLDLCTVHAIQLPSSFGMLVKVLANLDGITKQLDPDYSYVETARRFLARAMAQRFRWDAVQLDAYRAAADAKHLLADLPMRGNQVLSKLVEGELSVQLQHEGIENVTRHLDKIGNRIAYSLVVAALLIGSALFSLANIPPFIRGYPVIGFATFVGAVAMGIWLLAAILRSGSLR